MNITRLCRETVLSNYAVTNHLKILQEAGLVKENKSSLSFRIIRLADESPVVSALKELIRAWNEHLEPEKWRKYDRRF